MREVAHALAVLVDDGAAFEDQVVALHVMLPRTPACPLRGPCLAAPVAPYVPAATRSKQEQLSMKAAFLPDRGVVKVSGDDARHFPQRAASPPTSTELTPGHGAVRRAADAAGQDHRRFPRHRGARRPRRRLPARLSARAGAGARRQAQLLQAARQGRRSRTCRTRSACWRSWDGEPATTPDLAFADPRAARARLARASCPPELRRRLPAELGADLVDAGAYEAHRIALRRAARRARLHLRRRLPARSQHGPLRRRFRQGLLRRPGSGVARWSIAAPRAPASCRSSFDDYAPDAGVPM